MVQNFDVLSLRKDDKHRLYFAKIRFQGSVDNYEIQTNANIRHLDWLNCLSILDGFDMPFNEDSFDINITGLNYKARQKESLLEKTFRELVKTECSEKNLKGDKS